MRHAVAMSRSCDPPRASCLRGCAVFGEQVRSRTPVPCGDCNPGTQDPPVNDGKRSGATGGSECVPLLSSLCDRQVGHQALCSQHGLGLTGANGKTDDDLVVRFVPEQQSMTYAREPVL